MSESKNEITYTTIQSTITTIYKCIAFSLIVETLYKSNAIVSIKRITSHLKPTR